MRPAVTIPIRILNPSSSGVPKAHSTPTPTHPKDAILLSTVNSFQLEFERSPRPPLFFLCVAGKGLAVDDSGCMATKRVTGELLEHLGCAQRFP
jgi:hypothetical protein